MSNEQALRDALLQQADRQENLSCNAAVAHESAQLMRKAALVLPTAAPGDERVLYECAGCRHIYEKAPSSCDCCNNPQNIYSRWIAAPEQARAALPPATLPLLSDDEMPPLPEPVGYANSGYLHELQQRRIGYAYIYPSKQAGVSVPLCTADQLRARDRAVEAAVRKQMGVV